MDANNNDIKKTWVYNWFSDTNWSGQSGAILAKMSGHRPNPGLNATRQKKQNKTKQNI